MKTNKLLFFATLLWTLNSNAQLTLTKTANEPVAGDVQTEQTFDSTGVLPKNIGLNQSWNFSSIVQTTDAVSSQSFVAASSIPASSLFPGATLAALYSSNYFEFYKSNGSQFEDLGYDDVGAIMNYTNTQVQFMWPVSYGYSQTDTYSGQGSGVSASTDVRTGSLTTLASGTGTLTLPGGLIFTNVLQVKISGTDMQIDNASTPASTLIINETAYNYYHASQKFPLLTITYASITSGTVSAYFAGIGVNHALATVGIKNETKENLFSIFPNPANDNITLSLSNPDNQKCFVSISNALGQELKSIDLGSSANIKEQINVLEFAPGIYFIKTNLGKNTEVKKIVIE